MEQVLETVGSRRSAWGEMVQFVRGNYSHQEDWRFYGRNYGWAFFMQP